MCERLHAGIPWLRINGLHESRASEILVLVKPHTGGSYLIRKGRGPKNLGNQGVWIQCDRRSQLLQIIRRQGCGLFRISGRRLLTFSFEWPEHS